MALGSVWAFDVARPRGPRQGPQRPDQVVRAELGSAQRSDRAVQRIVIPKRSLTFFYAPTPDQLRGATAPRLAPVPGRDLSAPSTRVRDTLVARQRYFTGASR